MEKKEKLLKIENLTVEYHTDEEVVHAVNNVSLEINYGENVALVGETGAGKTSIAKAILRILPQRQSRIVSGKIFVNGQDINKLDEKAMRKIRGNKIAMIFQDPMTSLNPVEKVGDQIAEAIEIHEKVSRAEALRRAIDMMELVGIPGERSSEYPHQFSGGMKQRIVIAMGLACQPELLLADEPTTALDVTIQLQILKLMKDLKEEFNTAMIMVTHDLGIVAKICDRAGIMYAGEIIEDGDIEDIFESKYHHPYTVGLFGSIPDLTVKTERLHPIQGLMPDPADLPKGCKFHPRCPECHEECLTMEPEVYQLSPSHMIKCHLFKDVKEEGGNN